MGASDSEQRRAISRCIESLQARDALKAQSVVYEMKIETLRTAREGALKEQRVTLVAAHQTEMQRALREHPGFRKKYVY